MQSVNVHSFANVKESGQVDYCRQKREDHVGRGGSFDLRTHTTTTKS